MKLIPLNQGSDAWKAWRRNGLGGSDVATILGVMPHEDCTPALLLREKAEGYEKPTNFAMRRGTRLEPLARAAYERSRGCTAPPVCVEHEEHPWMRVSLDGLCHSLASVCPQCNGTGWEPSPSSSEDDPDEEMLCMRCGGSRPYQWILELKCPNWKAHDLALEGLVPDYYVPQVQWQLLVTGLALCHYASFSDAERFGEEDRLAVVTVEPDAQMQSRLLEEAGRFWARVLDERQRIRAIRETNFAQAVI